MANESGSEKQVEEGSMRNIIVIGETGSGKSSLINMMAGKDVAKTSDAATGCTFKAEKYYDDDGNCFFDTVGLNESVKGTVSTADAIRALTALFKSLESGVNLIIFVIRKGRITDTMVKNYTLFAKGICQDKVPVVLAISGCEAEAEPGAWFTQNKAYFEENGMTFAETVSGCFTKQLDKMKPSMQQVILESFDDTRVRVMNVLCSEKYAEAHKFGTWFSWLKKVFGGIYNVLAKFYGWPQMSLWDTMKYALMKALGMSETEATALANELAQYAE